MLALGVHARQGLVPLWQALVVLEVATLVGASALYFASAAPAAAWCTATAGTSI